MSERKVLNKYYPPDFDPSKIPRSKEKRNATFTIRLMAPCNMRCTTCGEYIYKGRKFNSRKEDVDDMNHLGLRIYRFYIKCTACLSEISFRTDPENTDYVLEAGATRNFEALAKAEKQAELEQKAYQEELKTNPMKLLEERTEASKNEMELMEALEDLQERSKFKVKIDSVLDSMITDSEKIRAKEAELEAQRQENEDDAYVKSIFGKDPSSSSTIKRLQDDEHDSSDEEIPRKIARPDKPTDIFGSSKSTEGKKSSWNKSIGGIGVKSKKNLLVKPKHSSDGGGTGNIASTSEKAKVVEEKDSKKDIEKDKATSTSKNALSLLANYSDSESE